MLDWKAEEIDDIIKVQEEYSKLGDTIPFTKKKMCEIVTPFRDKYKISDLDALRIARREVDLVEIKKIIRKD